MILPQTYVAWRKASRSKDDACVEAGRTAIGHLIGVRDTLDNGLGPILEFSRTEWSLFLATVKNGGHAPR